MKKIRKPTAALLATLFVAAPFVATPALQAVASQAVASFDRAYYVEGKGDQERLNVYNDGRNTYIEAAQGLVVSGATADAGTYIVYGTPSRIFAQMNDHDIVIRRGTLEPTYKTPAVQPPRPASAVPSTDASDIRHRLNLLTADINRLKSQTDSKSQTSSQTTSKMHGMQGTQGAPRITSVTQTTIREPVAVAAPVVGDVAGEVASEDLTPIAPQIITPTAISEQPQVAQAAQTAQAIIEPALDPVKATSPAKVWTIRAGEKFSDVFSRWAKDAEVQLVMDATDAVFRIDAEVEGTFVDVVVQAIDAINRSGSPIVAVFSNNNKVLQIRNR